ncbi:MAG: selenocysteine-specific translation elongation factor [Candidatus Cloacimonetes bacterium]|nr:selenocysteine-specific translation elongation factor [Candidatus Cloacimonadota bacterium]
MKHLIMGTAGHVDHGKTALIKALTNFDCDTHKDEKQRGITIHLGFTHLDLPNGNSIGIIDVPGHKDFINTMISGASTIDFVLFTIAANSSIMPQTREHLHIMELLGIKNGIIALTKSDTVDEEILELVELEINEFVTGTFLENAPIIRTSVKDSSGIGDLLKEINQIAERVEQRSIGCFFRMYIDRIFTMPGFGTIINGSVLQGRAAKGTPLYLLPGTKELRIRKMEHHGKEVDEVVSGQRASLNVVGLDIQDFQRGMLVSERVIKPSKMLDAKITLFEHERTFGTWNHDLFLMGTFEDQVRLHLLDKDNMQGGEAGLVQIHLDKACFPIYGDSFIIRSTSGDVTLGGGKILDTYPLHHKKRTIKVVQHLQSIAEGGLSAFLAAEVRKQPNAVSLKYLAEISNTPEQELRNIVHTSFPKDVETREINNEVLLITASKMDEIKDKITKIITKHHKDNPLIKKGKTFEELSSLLNLNNEFDNAILGIILKEMSNEGILNKIEGTFALQRKAVKLSDEEINRIQKVDKFIINSDMKVPLMNDIKDFAQTKGITQKELHDIINYLVENKKIVTIEGSFIHTEIIEKAKKVLITHFKKHDTLILADFRDNLQANRKICLLLLSYFDDRGWTIRKGDYRILSEKGKELLR